MAGGRDRQQGHQQGRCHQILSQNLAEPRRIKLLHLNLDVLSQTGNQAGAIESFHLRPLPRIEVTMDSCMPANRMLMISSNMPLNAKWWETQPSGIASLPSSSWCLACLDPALSPPSHCKLISTATLLLVCQAAVHFALHMLRLQNQPCTHAARAASLALLEAEALEHTLDSLQLLRLPSSTENCSTKASC